MLRDLVESHGAIQELGQIARRDVLDAAAQGAQRKVVRANALAGVAAVVGIIGTNLKEF